MTLRPPSAAERPLTADPGTRTDLGPLPWSGATVERILPHREPFLFVDQVLEVEPERRVVGVRTWSAGEALVPLRDRSRAVPVPYLAECMAQVGAVLILSASENRGRLIYFLGIERARFRAPVRAGDTLRVEARVRRLRSRIGTLAGSATVGGRRIAEGVMTFALADPGESGGAR